MSTIVIISKFLIATLILLGALINLASAYGLIRLPDIYTRSHAATKSTTLGILCILFGSFIYFWVIDGTADARIILAIVFIFMTAPLGGHLIGRAAYRSKVPLSDLSVKDDLRPTLSESDFQKKVEN